MLVSCRQPGRDAGPCWKPFWKPQRGKSNEKFLAGLIDFFDEA
jgi:hypothetical protein